MFIFWNFSKVDFGNYLKFSLEKVGIVIETYCTRWTSGGAIG